MGNLNLPILGQKVDGFFRDFGVERSFLFESRQQFAHGARIEQRAGKAVLPDLARLLQHVDIFLAELGVGIRWRCARRSAATGASAQAMPAGPPPTITTSAGISRTFDTFERFAENQHQETSAYADLHRSSRIEQLE